MGFKSLFRRKKRGGLALTLAQSLTGTPAVSSSSSANNDSSSLTSQSIEEELKQVFKKFDANDDGKISASELSSILSSLGYAAAPEEISAMIAEVDGDGDGHIDLAQFIELNPQAHVAR